MEKEIKIERKYGSFYTTKSYIQFNDGFSHIVIDDGCYLLVNGTRITSHIFPEALSVIKQLPPPNDMLDETKRKSFYLKYMLDQV